MRRGALLLAAAVAVAGCGSSGSKGDDGSDAALAAAKRYVAAFAAHDASATCAALSEGSREQVEEFAREHLRLKGATCEKAVALLPRSDVRAKVTGVTVDGDQATAAVDGFDRPLQLVREHGAWHVKSSPSGETD